MMLLYRELISLIWKMFVVLFGFVLVTAHAMEIPSYIHPCGRKDPNYDQCITENLKNIKNMICTGFPEFNIPPNEPIIIDKIVIYDTNSLKLSLKDTKIFKFCDLSIKSVHTDPDRLHFDLEALINRLQLDTSYDFDIRVLVPLSHKGLASITTENVLLKLRLDLKVITKNDEKQIYASKANTNLNITNFQYKFDESEKELVQLHQAIRSVVNNNTEDIINTVKPKIEAKVSQLFISIFNNISRSNYEKLFPEEV